MAKMGRPGMSDELRAQLWAMWGSGKSFSEISQVVGHPPGSIFTVVKQTGGYVPAPRKRRAGSLRLVDREEISRGLARGESVRHIARTLGRAPSTVSREIGRNKGRCGARNGESCRDSLRTGAARFLLLPTRESREHRRRQRDRTAFRRAGLESSNEWRTLSFAEPFDYTVTRRWSASASVRPASGRLDD